jgi:hypothetical protein
MLSRPLRLLVETRQLFDQLLADQHPDGRWRCPDASTTYTGSTVPRFYSSNDPPRVRATHRETVIPSDLAASGLRGKAAADNQSLRLHRPQATVSPTAVS